MSKNDNNIDNINDNIGNVSKQVKIIMKIKLILQMIQIHKMKIAKLTTDNIALNKLSELTPNDSNRIVNTRLNVNKLNSELKKKKKRIKKSSYTS